ncbi:hypothetical protein NP233_g1483 [Leucocoprinus birnbaumii]|uniref:DUF6699 domain-containing protein n=1 Tax=Leucocoprinus birnbaumii TaxID=56174 RepID=A0AAD5YUT5_9AGAR|nr:hypothetical protein NP233_g1483 [Leucocoprinus birnbaumii]
MSLSNPIYGTLPAFRERPASTGPTFDGVGGGGGGFMPPPPGASVGGEPGHYPSFQQSNPSSLNWPNPQSSQTQLGPQASAYPPWGSGYAHSHQSQHPQPSSFQPQPPNHYSPYQPAPTQHSPYHNPTQNSPYQPHASQRPPASEPGSTPWTYGQYPPSPEYPLTAPVTIPTFNHTPNASGRRSPYGVHIPQPPPSSAPAEAPLWAHLVHPQHHSNHSQTQLHQHHEHAPSHAHRPTHQRHHSNGSPGYLPVTDEPTQYAAPLPFRGSANAPPPKKSAMRRSNSQSAPGRHAASGSGSQPHTPRIQRVSSNGSTNGTGFGFGYNNGSASGWPQMAVSPATYPTMAPPTSAPAGVIPPMTTPNVPGYTLADEDNWGPNHLSPRPRDWRADYFPKQGFSMYLPRIGRARSDVAEYHDTVKRDLHPLLYHAPNGEPLTFDLRYPIVHGQTLLISQRNFNEIDLAQHAAFPAAPMLRLYHPKFPWYVDVHQSHPGGVTVFDVLAQLSVQSQAQIRSRHYYNDVLDLADRTALGKTYKERCRGRPGEGARGILQVDFLGDKYVFEGLARGKQGMWEIKTRSPEILR